MESKYTIELWTSSGLQTADLNALAKTRRFVLSRNEPEDISFQLPLQQFEDYARRQGTTADQLLIVGSTEVRVRRGSTYLCGGQIIFRNVTVNSSDQYIEVHATGFLNLFKDRFTAFGVDRVFTATEATTIAATLITESQTDGGSLWDFGVILGPNQATVGPHDRTYTRANIKQALQDLTNVQTSPFDFEFTADKQFNTYAAIGSVREDIIFEYPGNIKGFSSPKDGTGIANRVYVLGAGNGTDVQATATVDDTESQLNYKVRQKYIQESDVSEFLTLQDHGNEELAAWSNPFEIPALDVDGDKAPYVTDYGIGDYVRVRADAFDITSHINGLYRVEKMTIVPDDNDNENVTLAVSR